MRVGHGYDVHRLVRKRNLILGGVKIEHTKGLLGHSDADVLTHAIMDALLGAAALRDIGYHFSDSDEKYKGADSLTLLGKVVELLKLKGYAIINIDAVIVAQAPKLNTYIPDMIKSIAEACGISDDCVNVKATTEESLGFTGKKKAISAYAVCTIE